MSEGVTATSLAGAPKPDPLLGRVIADRFRIVSLIARGGMGKVYRAEQAPLGRVCALKVLNPNYNGDADPEFHRRFFREASITSRITHPNSVTIFDYGKTDDDVYYMAMEYLEGQTLHQALRERGTMPEERVGRITMQMCRALREAHALDVIHRDLKPANIFLTRHGDDEDFVKVLDFGLVKHLSERPEEQLTQTGLFMGSPKYMAPEQIQGGHVDARTDVYSLGIMLYEMLAGKVPFERATSVNILMAHVGEPPPPMRAINPNLVCSPAFEDLVMRCIAKNPNERYASMDAVLQAVKICHGSSMTGQLAAMQMSGVYQGAYQTQPPPRDAFRSSVNAIAANATNATATGPTGPFQPGHHPSHHPSQHPSHTPPPYHSGSAPGFAPAGASASLTPMGVQHALDVSGDSAIGSYAHAAFPPRRSKLWIGVGVLVAAVLGGLLGMAAFRMTASAQDDHAAAAAPSAPAAEAAPIASAAAAAATVASAPLALTADKTITLHVTSDPPGANVREDAAELCASTPCDVTFRGDAADPAKPHRLLLTHLGFRAELRVVKPGDPPLAVKLFRAGGRQSAIVPPPQTSAAAPPVTPKPADTTSTPNGFKDLPY